MKKERLVTLAAVCAVVLMLALVAAACGPAGPAGPAGPSGPPGPPGPAYSAPPAAKPNVSLAVVPGVQEASSGKTVVFIGAGLQPKQEIRLRISTKPELDVTLVGAKPPEVNESGAFEITLDVASFPAGTYTVTLLGAGEQVLATAPMMVVKPPPAKPKPTATPAASPKPTASPTATPPPSK